MKRFLAILCIMAAQSLSAVAPVISVPNDPCTMYYHAQMPEWQNLQKNTDYQKLQKAFMTAGQAAKWQNVMTLPENKALTAFTDNYWAEFRKEHPELEKPYEECQAIMKDIDAVAQEFQATDAFKKFKAFEQSQQAIREALNEKLQALRAEQNKLNQPSMAAYKQLSAAQNAFFAQHGYVQVPGVGFRRAVVSK